MKVVDGKFGKKSEEMSLADKVMASLASMIDENTKGNFVMLLDLGGDQILVSTDTVVADAVFLMEAAKLSLIMNPLDTEEVYH